MNSENLNRNNLEGRVTKKNWTAQAKVAVLTASLVGVVGTTVLANYTIKNHILGKLGYYLFSETYEQRKEKSVNTTARNFFSNYDVNGDGVIDREEFKTYLEMEIFD